MKNFLLILMLLLVFCYSCNPSNNKIPIAILLPVSHPSLDLAEKGFKMEMEVQSPGKYRFVTFNAQGSKTLMRSEIEEIANQNYALVLTIGTSASKMTKEVLGKKGLNIPIVFTAVNDPVGAELVDSEILPGGNVTGVKEELNFREELRELLRFKPDLKNLLLVYNPSEPGLEKDRIEIESILRDRDITLTIVEIFQTNELKAKVPSFMDTADAMLILKDNCVVTGLELLVKLCNQYKTPLMASDLDSPDRGATFGYGVHEIDFGVEAAKKALQIIEGELHPSKIPVTPLNTFELKINKSTALKQGIIL